MAGEGEKDRPVVGARCGRRDGHGRAPAGPQHAAEFGEPARRVGEEHQPEAAHHGVEALVGEDHRPAVLDGDRDVWFIAQPRACPLGHGGRDIGRRDVAGRTDGGQNSLGDEPRAGGDVEDVHPRREAGGAQQRRDEVRRHMREGAVVSRRRGVPVGQFLGHRRLLAARSRVVWRRIARTRCPTAARWRT